MTRTSWWLAVVTTAVVHVGLVAVPVQFEDAAEPSADPVVSMRLQAPPPEPEPQREPQPEPQPEPSPPEKPPPPEPRQTPPPPRPTPPPPEPAPAPQPAPPEIDRPATVPTPIEPAPTKPVVQEPKRQNPVPPPMPQPPPDTGPSKADYRAYAMGMRASFLRHRRYPPAALRLGLQGTAKVKLSVDRNGRLVGKPSIVRSTGHRVLDEEALRVIGAAAPFDPLPKGTRKNVMVFVIPIDFHIEEN